MKGGRQVPDRYVLQGPAVTTQRANLTILRSLNFETGATIAIVFPLTLSTALV